MFRANSGRHVISGDLTLYHLAALKADPAAPHLSEPTEQALSAVVAALDQRETAERVELNQQALATRKDFDLDELTRVVDLAALGAVGKDRASSAYRVALPQGLSWLVALRGRATLAGSPALDVDAMTPEERLELIGELWDSLEGDVPELSSEQRTELQRRMAEVEAHGAVGVQWSEVKAKLDRIG